MWCVERWWVVSSPGVLCGLVYLASVVAGRGWLMVCWSMFAVSVLSADRGWACSCSTRGAHSDGGVRPDDACPLDPLGGGDLDEHGLWEGTRRRHCPAVHSATQMSSFAKVPVGRILEEWTGRSVTGARKACRRGNGE